MPGVPPVPIPNTAVKPRAANGSRTIGPARVGRRQVYGPDAGNTSVRASFFEALDPMVLVCRSLSLFYTDL